MTGSDVSQVRNRDVKISVYGAGGSARETAWLIEQCSAHESDLSVAAFVDDRLEMQGLVVDGITICSFSDALTRFPTSPWVVAVGDSGARQILSAKVRAAGASFVSLIHPRVERSTRIEVGEGVVVCAGSVLSTNIRIGEGVQVNIGCTVSHDVILGDYATLSPGVHVCGHVHIGKRVTIGAGAVIRNGRPDSALVIGDDAVIGAGAVVACSLPGNATYVGVPAKAIPRD